MHYTVRCFLGREEILPEELGNLVIHNRQVNRTVNAVAWAAQSSQKGAA